VSETSVRTIATPNDQVSSYHYGLMTKDYFNEIGQDSAVAYFQADPYVFYGTNDFTWSDLEANTFYYGIATAQNALGEWGTPTIVEFYTSVTETSEGYSTITLFPVPADNEVTLTGAKHGTIRICNALGQTVDEFESNSGEFKINTSNYENGIYFIQIDEKTMKFVVRH
nr:T9SS type A sorting domain-containing protein [Bacteroidales bacterium]